jgi:hypothetical protein
MEEVALDAHLQHVSEVVLSKYTGLFSGYVAALVIGPECHSPNLGDQLEFATATPAVTASS